MQASCEKLRNGMLSDITTEMQQLIRNWTKLQTYVLLLVLFDQQRVLQQVLRKVLRNARDKVYSLVARQPEKTWFLAFSETCCPSVDRQIAEKCEIF